MSKNKNLSESIFKLNGRIKKEIEKVKSTMEYNYEELNKFSFSISASNVFKEFPTKIILLILFDNR